MKKIIKPIFLLGSIFCLVGCGKESLPLIDVNYATARGKCSRMLEEINNTTYETVKEKKITYSIVYKHHYENVSYTEDSLAKEIFAIDLENRIVKLSNYEHYEETGYEPEEYESEYYVFFDGDKGIISAKKVEYGNVYCIYKSIDDINNVIVGTGETIEQYVDSFMFDIYMNKGETRYLMYDSLASIAYQREEEFYSGINFVPTFKLNKDALEISVEVKDSNRTDYDEMSDYSDLMSIHFDGNIATHVYICEESRGYTHKGEQTYYLKDSQEAETKLSASIKAPNLDDYYLITSSSFGALF